MPYQRLDLGQPLPDPFIFTRPEGYYLTGSDATQGEEDKFDLFFSKDLLHWKKSGKLLILPDYEGSNQGNFRAPEILQIRHKFYLYYTADAHGDPQRRYVRASVAESLAGPYHDIGILTEEPSIDGHPFFDSKGKLYLIYTGNEGSAFQGQLVMDRFSNPNQLEGKPHRLFPDETVEWEQGAFTLRYKERILLLSSQGNWRDETYRVRVSQAQTPEGPFTRLTTASGPCVLLESSEDRIGPGHASVFRDKGRDLLVCYHAWDREKTGQYPWTANLAFSNNLPVCV
jgi:arabinan endo-1,5-alpha-L-arabinosidase